MSDVNVTEAAPDQGQAAEVEQPEGYQPEGERDYFDPSDYSDHYVRVRVDGEDIEVPLSEALNGYSRTADYTRKTQAHAEDLKYAEWAKNLEVALQQKRWDVLEDLATAFGRQMGEPQPDPQAEPEPQLSPEQERIAELEFRLDTAQLERDIAELSAKYPDFNPLEVVQAMNEAGFTRPDKAVMESLYKRQQADNLYAQHLATQAAAAVQAQQDAAITEQKRQDGIVAGGSRAAAPTAQIPTQGRSVEDAIALAVNEVNDGEWRW